MFLSNVRLSMLICSAIGVAALLADARPAAAQAPMRGYAYQQYLRGQGTTARPPVRVAPAPTVVPAPVVVSSPAPTQQAPVQLTGPADGTVAAAQPGQTIHWLEWDPALNAWVQKTGVVVAPPAPTAARSWRSFLRW